MPTVMYVWKAHIYGAEISKSYREDPTCWILKNFESVTTVV